MSDLWTIRFVWCPAHHGNGTVRPLSQHSDWVHQRDANYTVRPLWPKEFLIHGIWVCQNCGGHLQKERGKADEVAWQEVSRAV